MGNSISPMIQLTGDCPSSNQNKKMPVLDLQCWMGDDGTVSWEHYRKTMTNYLVILECSAMPNQMKRTTLTQERVRVPRNCRLDMSWEMKAVHLTDLSARMKASGYSEMFRQQVIMSAMAGFGRMVEVAEQGGRPVNRPRSWEAIKAEICSSLVFKLCSVCSSLMSLTHD